MLKLGLIGKGISRSQSARLHVLLGRMCGIDVTYDYLDSEKIADFDLIGQLTTCAKAGYAGVNVTHPYKTEARKLIQRRKRLPEALGAVNTVVFREDGWRGDNTDYVGFMRGYRGQFGDQAPGTVLQMGAGGVGQGGLEGDLAVFEEPQDGLGERLHPVELRLAHHLEQVHRLPRVDDAVEDAAVVDQHLGGDDASTVGALE